MLTQANQDLLARIKKSLPPDANVPGTLNNSGLHLMQQGNYVLAWAVFTEAVKALDETHGKDLPAYLADNMATCAKHLGRSDVAIDLYHQAIMHKPDFEKPQQNVSLELLRQCDFKLGWLYYRKRFLAREAIAKLQDPVRKIDFKHTQYATAAQLKGKHIALVSEQGLGDVLFFLRWAERTQKWGAASIQFKTIKALYPVLLDRYGPVDVVREYSDDRDFSVPLADLPLLTGHGDEPDDFPPSIEIHYDKGYYDTVRRCLAGRPRPWVGLQWRSGVAGLKHRGGIFKEYHFDLIEEAAEKMPGTKIILQRNVTPLEVAWIRSRDDVVNLAAVSDDIGRVASVLKVLDRYITVSNTNVHLAAGLGLDKMMTVLVPFPAEWRWAEKARWFSPAKVIRQELGGEWPPVE